MIEERIQSHPSEHKCFVIKTEKEFYSFIEKTLRDNGFEVLETCPRLKWDSCPTPHAI